MHRFIATVISVAVMPYPPAIVGFSHPHAASPLPRIPPKSSPPRHDVDAYDAVDSHIDIESPSTSRWGKSPPYLAILTEPDACASIERVDETFRAIELATAVDGDVDMVVLRVENDSEVECATRKWALLRRLAELKGAGGGNFLLVVNDDVDIVLEALYRNVTVDGVHVKERNAHLIPSIRSKLEHAVARSFGGGSDSTENVIIGTSCHSIDSAARSYRLSPRGPDYLFVGTCYPTRSHPEKRTVEQLEGPSLPGDVKRELYDIYNNTKREIDIGSAISSQSTPTLPPVIFAIGGIDERNCQEPVLNFDADGIAVIRTVMHAPDPGEVVRRLKKTMKNERADLGGLVYRTEKEGVSCISYDKIKEKN
ncbi:hypothetical protein ACHAXA_008331 [Cyclostephanos tholiformis]|uniref:Thiamine phosphate synthase/TenI domain-containing protein n=1 Tax=Cyclostephanos tholiformis TaxID=382380 RepID=A0ABD3R679_9STRA